jgi:hypothetical protein
VKNKEIIQRIINLLATQPSALAVQLNKKDLKCTSIDLVNTCLDIQRVGNKYGLNINWSVHAPIILPYILKGLI